MSLLGKLGPDAIPYDPIVLVTVAAMILGGLAAIAGSHVTSWLRRCDHDASSTVPCERWW